MNTESESQIKSSWHTRVRALGPGIMLAAAAVGASHIVSSAKAGAMFGWQLAVIIILSNLFKYPFFRFGPQYTLNTGKTLLEGYAEKSQFYVIIFFVLNVFAAVVNTAGVALLSAAVLKYIFPAAPMGALSTIVLTTSLIILLAGHYKIVDNLSKVIMVSLSITTVIAVVIAFSHGAAKQLDFVEPNPWSIATLPFIVALMGWMPCPIELSAISSMWLKAKQETTAVNYKDGLFDFNVGFIMTSVLALVFLALGALVQYGSGAELKATSGGYIGQFIGMYAATIGNWSRWLVAFIAFTCIYGTTLTVIDGYSRTNMESFRLVFKRSNLNSRKALSVWIIIASVVGLIIIFGFSNSLGKMLNFAMIASFVTTPIFAWLNLALVRKNHSEHGLKPWVLYLAWIGLFYLTAFTVFFILYKVGVFG